MPSSSWLEDLLVIDGSPRRHLPEVDDDAIVRPLLVDEHHPASTLITKKSGINYHNY